MTEAAAVQPARSARLLGAVAPGLPQLLAGRVRSGVTALAAWSGLLSAALLRRERAVEIAGTADGALALTALAGALAAVWFWSWRDAGVDRRLELRGWRGAMEEFFRGRTAPAGAVVLAVVVLAALLAPLLTDHDPLVGGSIATERLLAPSPEHPLGTDHLARDVLTRLLYGARISLTVGFLAAGMAATLGTLVGAVSGYLGGVADAVIMRGVDMVMAFPRLVLLIALVAVFQPSLPLIVVILGLTLWPGTARLVRGEVLSLRERDFIVAARALGYSRRRIVFRHLVPNALGPVIVAATLGVGNTIVLEAGLSFLGIGVQAPVPSWGSMVADGRSDLLQAWWLSTVPGLAIVLTVVAFNLVGDGLRDLLDPRAGR